jgi:transcriptional regulator NrdR family protein
MFNLFDKVTEPFMLTYINFVSQDFLNMVKTGRKKSSSSRTSKRKNKANSRVHSRPGKGKSTTQKRRRRTTTTTRQPSKSSRRTATNKRAKTSEIIIKRTSGRREKFETDKMAQTVSRSGTPFLLARDVAKTVSEKVISQGKDIATAGVGEKKRRPQQPSTVEVDGAEVRKMVAEELKERNRPDIASSYSGEQPENMRQGRYELMRENQPLHDADAANQSKLLFDSSTNMAKSTRPSSMKR